MSVKHTPIVNPGIKPFSKAFRGLVARLSQAARVSHAKKAILEACVANSLFTGQTRVLVQTSYMSYVYTYMYIYICTHTDSYAKTAKAPNPKLPQARARPQIG